jgi:hypothetical protein
MVQRRVRITVMTLALFSAAIAGAQTTAAPRDSLTRWFDAVAINAFVSTAYQYNSNRPVSGTTSYRVFDYDDNSLNLDVAEVAVQLAPMKRNDVGFRVDVIAGNSVPQVTKVQDRTVSRFDVQQIFASYIAPLGSGLRFDVGKYVTHMGYELIEGYDGYNDNYSRSILFGYAIPFTHTGVKASYAFSSKASAMVEVVQGWDLLRDNNHAKSIGAQLTFTPATPFTVMLNWIGGAELADDNHTRRNVFDLVATLKPSTVLTLGVNGDYGIERGTSLVTPGADAIWKGIAGYATLVVTRKFSVALRGETFHDDGGTRLGVDARGILSEVTVTPAIKVTDHVVVRGEVRYDKANQPLFARESALNDHQTTVGANVIFVY